MVTDCNKKEVLPEIEPDTFWEASSPSSQNMDASAIEELAARISRMDGVYSYLLVRNGRIVHEQYYNGANSNSLLHIRSITKRITATLAGIAIDKGYIDSLEAPVSIYFNEVSATAAGIYWDRVTVYHLLNMVSGMDWNEDRDLHEYENNLSDPLNYIFGKDIIHPSGTWYAYNSPGIHLISCLIDRTIPEGTMDFAEKELFDPLGIRGYQWEKDGNDVPRGGAGLELTARDLAKIGLLYLQNGQWEGKQIVSTKWIDRCLSGTIPLDSLQGGHIPGISIGQSWWKQEIGGKTIHFGDGYGGQILLVVPEYHIIVVMNRNYRVEAEKNIAAFDSFFNEILPAVLNSVEN